MIKKHVTNRSMYLDLIDLLIKVTKNSNCYNFVNKFLEM